MTAKQWDEICKDIIPHLDALRDIAEGNSIEMLNMAASVSGYTSAFCICDGIMHNCDGRGGIHIVSSDISEKSPESGNSQGK